MRFDGKAQYLGATNLRRKLTDFTLLVVAIPRSNAGAFRGIIAGNDTMALGAAAAVRSAGIAKMVVTGFDGSPDALAAIRAGQLRATSLQPALVIARLAVEQADRFLKTHSTGQPERQVIPCDLVTKANVDDFADFAKIR